MSGPNPAPALLDGLIIGEPISDHQGVRCYPALADGCEDRYMIKTISIPASQTQLDALLLTGAFANVLKAQEYFAEQAEAVVAEADLLDRLSKTEGFLPFQRTQIVKMTDGVGYDVHLLAPYRESLEERMRQEPLTHLAAVNLGLDMCAAMAASRRAGYLHLDLKPSNIFLTDNRGYCIGDLGFIRQTSLAYASFPEKYRSRYTAPEIQDAMSPMNQTVDIYALGLTLYQVYNNGQLPSASGQEAPPPQYADYEMAQIILKACAPSPEDRWQSPAEMGQALVEYMQRNEVNDVSIIPPPVELVISVDEPEEFLTEEENDEELAMLLAMIPDEEPPAEETEEDEDADSIPEEAPPLTEEEADAEPAASPPDEDDAPAEDERTEDGVTTEVAQMLAQADVLIEHELPEPVVAPDPIEIPIPPPIIPEPEPEPEKQAPAPEVIEDPPNPVEDDPPPEPPPPEAEDDEEIDDMPEKKKKLSPQLIIRIVAVVLLLAVLGAVGFYYYNNVYTQTIDNLEISGIEDQIIVRVTTKADTSKLTVTCSDAYGNTVQSGLTSGVAIFNGMKPDTQYTIEVTISGNHKLSGKTTGSYTTGSQTKVMNFTAVNGAEDGSVVLSFNVMGPDSKDWTVSYGATNIPAKEVTFEGNRVELSGLSVGVSYTFRLTPVEDLYLTGDFQINHTVQGTILAENLTISAYYTDFLSVIWNAPNNIEDVNWIVRCYNDAGYDQTGETTGNSYIFSGLAGDAAYTVTITAQGMTQSVSVTTEGMTPIENPTQPPEQGSNTENPDQGGNTQNPEQGGNTQNPEQDGNTQNPEQGGNTQNPEQGNNNQDPDQGEDNDPQNPDQGDDPTQNPEQGGNTQHPSQGGNTQNPEQGGNTQTPSQGGNTQNPSQGGNTQNPEQGGNAEEVLTITGFNASTYATPWNLKLSWSYIGTKPSGWIITYTTNGKNPIVMKCSENSINIIVSSDDEYVFEVRPADDVKYISEPYTYSAQNDYYSGHGFDSTNASYSLVSDSAAVTSFSSDAQVYIQAVSSNVDTSVTDKVSVTIWIRNANGDIISAQSQTIAWNEMWANGKCNVLIPKLPDSPGSYTVDLLFDYLYVTYLEFQIV